MATAQFLPRERGRLDRLSFPREKIAASRRRKVSRSGSHGTYILATVKPEPGEASHSELIRSHEGSMFTVDYGDRVPAAFEVKPDPPKTVGRLVHDSMEPFHPRHQAYGLYFSPAPETNPAAGFETATSVDPVIEEVLEALTPLHWHRYVQTVKAIYRSLQEQRQEQEEKQDRQRLWNRLDTSFAHEDLDPDRDHPAERTLVRTMSSLRGRSWLLGFCTDEKHPELAASLLLCLCRLPAPHLVEWEKQLISRALACDDVEIRDASVQLAVAWGGDHLQGLLQSHQEREDWLQDYIGSVLADWSI